MGEPFTRIDSSKLSNGKIDIDESKAQLGEELKSSFKKRKLDRSKLQSKRTRNLECLCLEHGKNEWTKGSHEKSVDKLSLVDPSLQFRRVEQVGMVQGSDGPSPPEKLPDEEQENEQEPPADAQDESDRIYRTIPCTTAEFGAHVQEQRNQELPLRNQTDERQKNEKGDPDEQLNDDNHHVAVADPQGNGRQGNSEPLPRNQTDAREIAHNEEDDSNDWEAVSRNDEIQPADTASESLARNQINQTGIEEESDYDVLDSSGSNYIPQRDIPSAWDSGYGSSNQYVDFYKRTLTPMCRGTLMVVGPKDAGKTSLVHTLLGERFRDTKANVNGKDLETDISNCTISYTNILPNDANWKPLDVPLHQMLNEYLESKFADETLPNVGEVRQGGDGTLLVDPLQATVKILDMSGEFGFYKTHQMFLGSSMVFLLVIDVTKPLDENLSKSAVMKEQEGKLEIPRTPREFLDFLLNTISTFVGTGNGTKSVIIVLTHTDEIDPQTRDAHVKNYRKEIKKHLKGQYVCNLVDKIVALSNKERDESIMKNLRSSSIKLCKAKPTYGEEIPCTWLKCEVDILSDSDTSEKRYLTIRNLRDKFESRIRMSAKQVAEFLKFHSKHGSMIHFDSQELDSLVVTDPQFLVDKFTSIIDMWKAKKTSQLSLDSLGTEDELANDLDEGILSTRSLNIIWDQMELRSVERLAKIMVKFCQFIQWDQRTENQTISSKFIIPALLPPAINFESQPLNEEEQSNNGNERQETTTLVYFFHKEVTKVKSSGFLPAGFLQMLVASLLVE